MPLLRAEYDQYHYHTPLSAWKKKWTMQKLKSIQNSITFDSCDNGSLNSFLKMEVYREKMIGKLPAKARLIQAYRNEHASFCEVHKYQSFAHSLKVVSAQTHLINGVKYTIRYASGMSHDDISNFVNDCEQLRAAYHTSFYYERDGVNWDASRGKSVMLYLHTILRSIDTVLGDHFYGGIKCKGTAIVKKKMIKYVVDGTRKSGHQDTSSGNSADNMETVYQAVLLWPTTLRDALREVRGLVLGDDLWVIYYFDAKIDPILLYDSCMNGDKACGVEPEARVFDNVFDTSFISLSFYPTFDGRVAAGPKIGRMLSGLLWTHHAIPAKYLKRYRTEVCQPFLPMYKDCPLIGSWLRQHISSTHVANSFIDQLLSHSVNQYLSKGVEIDWNNYFSSRYGLLPGWERGIVRDMRSAPPYSIIQNAVTDIIIDQDLCDIGDRWFYAM